MSANNHIESNTTASEDRLIGLIARTASGSHEAFQTLYERTSPRLFAIALGIVKENQLAEDVLQEAFVQIWHRAGDYHRERGKVITWLSSILRYRAIDNIRRFGTNPPDDNADGRIVPNDGQDQTVLALSAGQDAGRLDDCLGTLTESQRLSITLAYYRGLTHEELAGHLETPIGTVKSRIRRGLARLKECLEL